MKTISRLLFALGLLAFASPLRAEGEKRIAFVVGNAAYEAGPLASAANDAGLIAQTLQAAGFDVTGARDLNGEELGAAFGDFLDKAQASGPDTVAFVYLAGYGAQLDGENYFVPVDAKIAAAQDVAVEALRISDYTKRLAGLPLKASFIVLDAARASPFVKSGPPLAGGLALVDADSNMLVAFNAAPGTAAPAESGSYGAYAQALAEMIRQGGLSPADVFDGVRLRVNEATKGAQVPWDTSRIASPFVFFERAADAPPPAFAAGKINALQSRPLRDLGASDAYAAAIERDTLEGYEDFLAAYPNSLLANRVRGLLAARREAITWRETTLVNTPDAYWSYLDRYPRGPHAAGARRRLAALAATEEPPPSYSPIVYDVPPPPPPEIVYVDRPVLIFDNPVFGFVPPPPIVFLAPPPPYLVSYFIAPPPPPPVALFVLPYPVFVPIPVWVNPPAYVAPPPANVIVNNIHNTVVVNNTTNSVVVTNPNGQVVSSAPITAAAAGAGLGAAAAASAVALPQSVAKKASMGGGPNLGAPAIKPGPGQMPGALPGQPGALSPTGTPPAHALPGADGKPVPGPAGKPGAPPGQPGALPPTGTPPAHPMPGTDGKPLPGPAGKPGALPGRPGALPPTATPPAHALPGVDGKPVPGPAGKPGAPPGQPGALPPTGTPPAHPMPGVDGKPLPGPAGKPGMLPGRPGALPPTRTPPAHALPGADGKPLPGPAGKPGTPPQSRPPAGPGSAQKPPGTPSLNKPPATHALPSGQQLPPLPGGLGAPSGAKPGRTLPPGALPPPQQRNNRPPPQTNRQPPPPQPAYRQQPPQPAYRQQQQPQPAYRQQQQPQPAYRQQPPPQPAYRQPPPQPAYRQQPPPQPAYRPPPPQPAYRQPPPPQPAYRQQPPPQPAYRQQQQPQQSQNCGRPGLPACR